jgi:hypothetical protein
MSVFNRGTRQWGQQACQGKGWQETQHPAKLSPTTKHFRSTTRSTITVRNAHRRDLISLAITSALKGFQWLKKTIEKFLARAVQLYEQEQGEPFGSPQLGLYVRRWVSWVNAGPTKYKSDCEMGNTTNTSLWIHYSRILRINQPMAGMRSAEGAFFGQ